MDTTAPLAYIFSDTDFLGKELSRELTVKGCRVTEFSCETFPKEFSEIPSYIFLIRIEDSFSFDELTKILKLSETNSIKTQVILPYELDIKLKDLVDENKNRNLEIVYLQKDEHGVTGVTLIEKLIRAMFSYGFGKRETVFTLKEVSTGSASLTTSLLNMTERVVETPIIRPIKILNKRKKFKFRRLGIIIMVLLWIVAIPFLSLLVSGITLKKGFENISANNFKNANLYFSISKRFSDFSQKTLIIGGGDKLAYIIGRYDNVGMKMSQTISNGEGIIKNIFGSSDYDLPAASDSLYLNLDDLYKQVSFLRADTTSSFYSKFFLPGDLDLAEIVKYVDMARKIVRELPIILGGDKPTNYLVVELSGWKISKLGIYTFNRGHLTNKNMFDAAQADNQLKGIVQPPDLLKKYLGITNWYLKDANWDPDFSQTGSKIEWFLDKEMNQPADGVIAINSNIFNNINIFDALTLLKTKDIQIFSNSEKVQSTLAQLSWDGGFNIPTCTTTNCEVELLSVTEDNFGGNEVKSSINRSVNFFVNKTVNPATYNLEIDYRNLSKTDKYKTYVRVDTSINSNFGRVVENINNLDENLAFDTINVNGRSEAGVLVQIPTQASARLTFTWTKPTTLDFQNPGNIMFYYRRQPGTADLPSDIRFILPSALTHGIPTSYNTSLEQDFNKKIEW